MVRHLKIIDTMRERIITANKQGKRIKLIFEYPNAKSAKVRRGYVKVVREDSFDFLEDKDGLVTYAYKYIVEVKND